MALKIKFCAKNNIKIQKSERGVDVKENRNKNYANDKKNNKNSNTNDRENYEILNENMEETRKIFSERLKKLLYEKGYTQKSFSRKAGISEGSISNFVKGSTIPKESLLIVIAKQLGVSKDYLVGQQECKDYKFKDINEKTGLSEKAISTLYKLQHDYGLFEDNFEIDIEEKRKKSSLYQEHLEILNKILENEVGLFWLLDNIKNYITERDKIFSIAEKQKENNDIKLPLTIIDGKTRLMELKTRINYSFQELLNETITRKKK